MYSYLYVTIIFFVFLFLEDRCDLEDYTAKFDDGIKTLYNNGFSIKFDNSEVYNSRSIDFYDGSSHIIYLKEGKYFTCDGRNSFSVKVGDQEIYSGHIEHSRTPVIRDGPVIRTADMRANNIIPIGLNDTFLSVDWPYSNGSDPRNSKKVIDALKSEGLYREGISARIIDIKKTYNNGISLNIRITNNDSEEIYYLDPDRLGNRRYHYFTDGLTLTDPKLNNYLNNAQYEVPTQSPLWRDEWMSLLEVGESKTINIVYPDFDELPVGSYYATFTFPGSGPPEGSGDIWYKNGRIWLGDLQISKIVHID